MTGLFVYLGDGETFERLLLRFRRGVEAAGFLREARRRLHFQPAHERRRARLRQALRRQRGRRC